MRPRTLCILVMSLISTSGLSADDQPGMLLAVDRAALSLPQLRDCQLSVYHVFEDVVLVRATEADRRLLEVHKVKTQIIGGDPERETYWLLPRKQNPGFWQKVPASTVIYRSSDALILNRLPPDEPGRVSAVGLQPGRWELSSLQAGGQVASAVVGNDSLVAAITALVNPDTIRWFIQSLQDFGTRYAGATTRDSVAGWIRSQFLRMGYTDVSFQEFTWSGLVQKNVVAVLPGPQPSGETVVVGGHHDSNSFGNPMVSAPGADDNASGTAAVLEIARVLKAAGYEPELSIRFMTFAAEEVGLLGSWVDAGAARQSGEAIRLMVNHDMIAHTLSAPGASSVDLNYYTGAEGYQDLAMQTVRDFTILTPRMGTPNSGGSDSYSYWREGFPAIYFEERDFSPYYHSPQDILANATVDYCAEVIRASCATVLRVSFIPGMVRNLVVRDRGDGTSLLLSWSGVTDVDLAGYRVRVSSAQRDTTLFTADTVLVVGNLLPEVPVTAAVVAEDFDGNTGLAAQGTGTPSLAPLPPAGIVATPEWHRVVLQWQGNREVDLLGYRVYRSDAPGSEGVALTTEAIAETVFVDSTAVPGTFHYYTVRAVDSAGTEGVGSVTLRSRVVSLDQGILLVDETADGSTPPGNAPDSLHDAFYQRLVSDFAPEFYDVAQESGIDLAVMGAYSTLIWYGDDISDVALAAAARTDIARYLEYGGRFLYAGFRPSRPFSDASAFMAEFAPGDFIYDYLRIRRRESPLFAPGMNAARSSAAGFADLLVDPSLSPPVQDGHLRNVEAIFAAQGGAEIYTYDSALDTTGVLKGKPVGVYSLGSPFQTVVLSFPLAYMVEEDARALLHHVLTDVFSEPTAVETPTAELPGSFALAQNYPNPFNPSTTLRFELPREAAVTVTVYDLLGREVATLFRASAPAGRHELLWDASAVTSGVYFLRLEARSETGARLFTATRKVLLLK